MVSKDLMHRLREAIEERVEAMRAMTWSHATGVIAGDYRLSLACEDLNAILVEVREQLGAVVTFQREIAALEARNADAQEVARRWHAEWERPTVTQPVASWHADEDRMARWSHPRAYVAGERELKDRIAELESDLANMRRERNAASRTTHDGFWVWSDTDSNDLDGLCEETLVTMTAGKLRELLTEAREMAVAAVVGAVEVSRGEDWKDKCIAIGQKLVANAPQIIEQVTKAREMARAELAEPKVEQPLCSGGCGCAADLCCCDQEPGANATLAAELAELAEAIKHYAAESERSSARGREVWEYHVAPLLEKVTAITAGQLRAMAPLLAGLAFAVQRGHLRQRHFVTVATDVHRGDRWSLVKLGAGVWEVSPSVHFAGQIHAFVTLVGVPDPAPWEGGG